MTIISAAACLERRARLDKRTRQHPRCEDFVAASAYRAMLERCLRLEERLADAECERDGWKRKAKERDDGC